MPYTKSQCIAFAIMEKQGKKVPEDWRKHCEGKKRSKSTKTSKENSK